MPRLSKRAQHFKSQKKDEKGKLVKRDEISVETSTVDNVEDCQLWKTTVSTSCLDRLRDNNSSISVEIGWRKTKEAQKVDPRATLFNFGITLEEKPLPVAEVEMSASQKELVLIEKSLDSIKKINKPVMNKKNDGSSLESYNFFRYTVAGT
ncbi:hypothetical protein BD560DRAFT_440166 [Blakeslea trispora]|nr:hypothetical protein BD560DRAFT_440166 [Blakeslea trispora]